MCTTNAPLIEMQQNEELLLESTSEGPRWCVRDLLGSTSSENIRRSLPMCSKYRFCHPETPDFTAAPSLGSPTSGIDPGTIFGCSGVSAAPIAVKMRPRSAANSNCVPLGGRDEVPRAQISAPDTAWDAGTERWDVPVGGRGIGTCGPVEFSGWEMRPSRFLKKHWVLGR